MCKHNLYFKVNIYFYHCNQFFSDLESNISHSRSTHKSKKKKPTIFSNPGIEHLQHYVNTNFQPDFHRDGKETIIIMIF